MSLDGLRAWIGEVERKLGKRTRVFLALSTIAIGIGGAAIYLAIDARESSVSEGDVQALQERLEAQIDEAATTAPTAPEEPAEPAPEPGESAPEPEPRPAPKPKSEKSGGDGEEASSGGTGTGGEATGGASSGKIQDLLERAKEQNAQAEEEQAGK
jgi:hypothetical protein